MMGAPERRSLLLAKEYLLQIACVRVEPFLAPGAPVEASCWCRTLSRDAQCRHELAVRFLEGDTTVRLANLRDLAEGVGGVRSW